ncbi:hypothetical protein DRQ20_01650 [bacterium]|nr:MAG: hypothetical protein DRQ20_01650 [bacterium]
MKIWILYSSRKGGHRYPSLALKEYIRENTSHEVFVINLLDYAPVASVFDTMGRIGDLKLRSVWKMGYRRLQQKDYVFIGAYRILTSIIFAWDDIKGKLKKKYGSPDIIVSIQPEVNAFSHCLSKWFKAPIFSVIIDLALHALWLHDEIIHYFLPHESMVQEMLHYNVPSDKFTVTGMPLRKGFSQIINIPPEKLREEIGISPDAKVVLLMGGLLGTMVDFKKVIKNVLERVPFAEILAVFGKNEKGRREAEEVFRGRKNVHIFGLVEEIEKMMWMSDVVVSKPGSVTMAESLSLGKPMVVITPLAGSMQEIRFAKFLEEKGAGIWIKRAEEAGDALRYILSSHSTIENMKENAKALGRLSLNGCRNIITTIEELLKIKTGVLHI